MNIYSWCEWNYPNQTTLVVSGIREWLKHTEKVIITTQLGLDFKDPGISFYAKQIIPGSKLYNGKNGFIPEIEDINAWRKYAKFIKKACNDCRVPVFIHECESRLSTSTTINWKSVLKGLSYLPKDIEHWVYPISRNKNIQPLHKLFLDAALSKLTNLKIIDQTQGFNSTWNLPTTIKYRDSFLCPLIPMLYCYDNMPWSWKSKEILNQIYLLYYPVNIVYPGQHNFENAGKLIFSP